MAFIVKHYVVKTLTSVCGEYVEGITSDNLDVSLLSGEVTLRDLTVKPAVSYSDLLAKCGRLWLTARAKAQTVPRCHLHCSAREVLTVKLPQRGVE